MTSIFHDFFLHSIYDASIQYSVIHKTLKLGYQYFSKTFLYIPQPFQLEVPFSAIYYVKAWRGFQSINNNNLYGKCDEYKTYDLFCLGLLLYHSHENLSEYKGSTSQDHLISKLSKLNQLLLSRLQVSSYGKDNTINPILGIP